jgi:hypothetical protein
MIRLLYDIFYCQVLLKVVVQSLKWGKLKIFKLERHLSDCFYLFIFLMKFELLSLFTYWSNFINTSVIKQERVPIPCLIARLFGPKKY